MKICQSGFWMAKSFHVKIGIFFDKVKTFLRTLEVVCTLDSMVFKTVNIVVVKKKLS